MISHRNLPFAVTAALLLALPAVGHAQDAEEEESAFSWSIAATTDYVFRGVSQSDGDGALQIGLGYELGSGFYVGVWGSNIDFGDGPNIELDTFIGWNHDFNESWNFDVMLNRYNYLGDEDVDSDYDGNYNELISKVTYAEMISFTLGYTNDVYALDEDGWYYGLAGTWEVGHGFSLGAGVGLSTFASDTGIEDYTDWNVSLSRDFGPVNAAIGYYDTDSDGEYNFGDNAEDRVVLTLSVSG
jgi:uncharacterized protein (TIGR02001 family)